jgi:hypothetical protein
VVLKGEYYVDFTAIMYTLLRRKDILAPGTVILSGNFKLVKKIEDLNEFWAVLKHKKSFYARHRMYPPLFLDIKNNRRLDKGRLLLDCCFAGNQSANFQLNK